MYIVYLYGPPYALSDTSRVLNIQHYNPLNINHSQVQYKPEILEL
jgi:hypothetical protein